MLARLSLAQPEDGWIPLTMLVMGAVGYFLLTYIWFSLPAFLTVVMDQFSLSNTQAGVLTGAIPFVYVPLSLISGLLIDRLGARWGVGLGLVLLGIAQLSRGFAVGFWTLLLPTLLIGLGGTGVTFGLPKLVASLFPSHQAGTMSSVYLFGAQLGIASSFGLSRPYLGPLLGGWRGVLVGSGVVALVLAGIWAVLSLIWSATYQRTVDRHGNEEEAEASSDFTFNSLRGDIRSVLVNPSIGYLVVLGTMYLLLVHALQAWLSVIFEARHFHPDAAGQLTSWFILARILGLVVIPPLSDYTGSRSLLFRVCGILTVVGTAGLVYPVRSVPVTMGVLLLVGIGLGGVAPLIRTAPIELEGIGPRLTGTAVGVIFTVGEIGGFFGPFLLGFTRDVSGDFVAGLLFLVAGGLVMVLAGRRLANLEAS